MSDTTVPQGIDPSIAAAAQAEASKAAVEAAARAAAESAAAKAKDDPEIVRMTPAALQKRLAEERAKGERDKEAALAAMLGGDIETAKKLIADAKAKEDAQKSEVQRLTEQLAAEKAKLAQFDTYKTTVEGRAAAEYAALSDVQKAAVDKIAGTDSAARLSTIDALRPTWIAAVQAAAVAAQAAADKAAADAAKAAAEAKKTAPIPAPATTTPAAPPPPTATPGQPTNHLAVWEGLKVSNPALAARYRQQHNAAIVAAQRQATG